ncbi:MAG: polysaccharide deacetylase family protein, partial [Alphaproteobacteria bacterium]|nr:polysaccharide deacetylase family protein [Alphaproteobacteria bacterium]
PSKNNTKDIVNYLYENKAHATFFMLGNSMSNNPDIVLSLTMSQIPRTIHTRNLLR